MECAQGWRLVCRLWAIFCWLNLSGLCLESTIRCWVFSFSLELGSWDAQRTGTKTKKDTKKPPCWGGYLIFEIVNGAYITLNRSGSDLLFRALRRSTIGTKTFHFRVRDGTGWDNLVITTRSIKSNISCLIMQAWARFMLFKEQREQNWNVNEHLLWDHFSIASIAGAYAEAILALARTDSRPCLNLIRFRIGG